MAAPRATLERDVSLPVVHLIRHAQGYHQLPPEAPREDLPDPDITPYGKEQCEHLRDQFPYHDSVDLLCASPIRRAIQTARIAFAPVLAAGHKILLLPDAQESSDKPMDIASPLTKLKEEFGDLCDYSIIEAAEAATGDDSGWRSKTGLRRNEMSTLNERARQLRVWLRNRPQKHIVLVSHGLFAHYLTGNIDATGAQTGEYWMNIRWRSFAFASPQYQNAIFVETDESMNRAAAGLNPTHHAHGDDSPKEGREEAHVDKDVDGYK